MTLRDVRDIAKLIALTAIAWLVPPRFWRQAALTTKSIGQRDLCRPAYINTLAEKYSSTQIAGISNRCRIYTRELKLQILGLNGPWRSWRPKMRLNGTTHLQKGIENGHGIILWVTETSFSTLIVKMALDRAGYQVIQLSRPGHGFSTSPFGIRFLNPIWTRVEDRFIAERVLILGETAGEALAVLRTRLAANRIVVITVAAQAHKFVVVAFLSTRLRLPTGPIRLARTTGALLLPIFTIAKEDGGFEVTIEAPLNPTGCQTSDDSIAAAYAQRLEPFVRDYPDQWNGWYWLMSGMKAGSLNALGENERAQNAANTQNG